MVEVTQFTQALTVPEILSQPWDVLANEKFQLDFFLEMSMHLIYFKSLKSVEKALNT